MTQRQWGALLLLAALWGGSFLFMKIAAPVLGPVLLIALRVMIAGLALLLYGLTFRRLPPLRPHWREYLIIGGINSALPFLLIATASLSLPASLTASLNATTPLFSLIVAALWTGEGWTGRKLGGLLLGLVGVATLMGLGPVPLGPEVLLAASACLLAALSYGVAALYTRVRMPGGDPLGLATYSQLFAALLLLPVVPFALPEAWPGAVVVGSVLGLALLSTAVAYLLYFYLIIQAGATKATMVTYLSPAFGILWGALLLEEPLGLGHVAGFGLILGSVALVSAAPAPVRTVLGQGR